MSTYSNAHANVEKGIFVVKFQGKRTSLVSFQMIFEALKSDLIRFKFHSPGSKVLKISEFILTISHWKSWSYSKVTFRSYRMNIFDILILFSDFSHQSINLFQSFSI